MNSGHGFETGDWIVISEKPDPAIPVTMLGDDGNCTWCGENDTVHFMTQMVQATNVSGNNVTLSRPLYYAFQSGLSPVAEQINFGVTKAGLENIRLDGSFADHDAFIYMEFALFDWVKGVETYDAGSGSKHLTWNQSGATVLRFATITFTMVETVRATETTVLRFCFPTVITKSRTTF